MHVGECAFMHVGVCFCVRGCVKEREKEPDRKKEKQGRKQQCVYLTLPPSSKVNQVNLKECSLALSLSRSFPQFTLILQLN